MPVNATISALYLRFSVRPLQHLQAKRYTQVNWKNWNNRISLILLWLS